MASRDRRALDDDDVRRLVDADSRDRCAIRLVPDGPALVRGADTVRDADGVAHPARRPVVGVCACGMTQRSPWCDATHKSIRSSTLGPTSTRES